MNQNRKPPAYMEYVATIMANCNYRVMSLQERGLLYSMRLEYWMNGEMPADTAILSRLLGFDEERVAESLPAVMNFFEVDKNNELYSRELRDYRKYLDHRRKKQIAGGKMGAAISNKKRKIVINLDNGSE